MNLLIDVGHIAPLLVTAAAACVVLLATVAGGVGKPAPERSGHLAFVGLLGLCGAGWLLWTAGGDATAFSGAIRVDGIGRVFGLITVLGATISIFLTLAYTDEHRLSAGEFIALILFATVGMMMVAMAGDLITLFIAIETMSLAVYALAGYRRGARRSQEAALKYFVYGAFASGFLLFGIALLFGEVGRLTGVPSVSLVAVGRAFALGSPGMLGWAGVLLVFSGLLFKIAAVPFHMWAPDVYEGAPTPATGFMAVGVKAAAFAALCRFCLSVFSESAGGSLGPWAIDILAIITMIFGNFVAIRQTHLKRLLAYSSIAHAGYALVGVGALLRQPTGGALEAIAYYLFGYTTMTLGAFAVILAFEARDERHADMPVERLADVGHRYPALGLAMSLFMFSLAGIPPSVGFVGKLSLFAAAVQAGMVPVVVVAVLASAVGAYYYLRVLVVMYVHKGRPELARVQSTWLSMGVWICASLTLFFGLLPEGAFGFLRQAMSGWLQSYVTLLG